MDNKINEKALTDKLDKLNRYLSELDSLLVAYSGGVDSTFLLRIARDVLGNRVTTVTVTTAFHDPNELEEAQELAEVLGVRHITANLDILADRDVVTNPPERCYFCKKVIMGELRQTAKDNGISFVADGSNADDADETETRRPGLRALDELGIISPLKEAGLTKAEIRELSRRMGLTTWDKPAAPCLATRFPYGYKISQVDLERVLRAEKYLERYNIALLRVRDYDDTARIEVTPDDIPALVERKDEIVEKLKMLGYTYVTLDLEGYRSGSMDEVVNEA
ncbi:MAG: ATP-dependent sacrificial sulfur transferase LarE [bacterium]|nr:ATP-dependent sacrificial sulfur transferase LarE [bacterium]